MKNRPRIRLKLTTIDKLFEIAGWIALLLMWSLFVSQYAKLPNTIPIHFNAAGIADGFGNKTTLFMLPVIASVLFIGMTLLNQFPHIFNYPVKITEENAFWHYTKATQMIRYLKFIIVAVFGFLMFKTIQTATDKSDGLGSWFTITMLILIFVPLLYYLIQVFRKR